MNFYEQLIFEDEKPLSEERNEIKGSSTNLNKFGLKLAEDCRQSLEL